MYATLALLRLQTRTNRVVQVGCEFGMFVRASVLSVQRLLNTALWLGA